MYDFFVQPQVDRKDNSIFGYEMLLRERKDGHWGSPEDKHDLPVAKQIKLVKNNAKIIKKHTDYDKCISFNLSQKQMEDPQITDQLVLLSKSISPLELVVEFTADISFEIVQRMNQELHFYGIKLAIDNVGSYSDTYEDIRKLLPLIDKIKLTMQQLRDSNVEQNLSEELLLWVKQAQKYDLKIILEDVADYDEQLLAEKYGINIQQGQLYGDPVLI